MPFDVGRYAKTVTALITGIIGWATLVVGSPPSHITAAEWVALGTAVAVALGVFSVPNTPPG